jgi:hypothetical protein
MDLAVVLTIASSVVVAIVGYLMTYRNSVRLARRKDRLDRVSAQLSDFYGPLFAYAHAGERTFRSYFDMHRPPGARSLTEPPLTEDEQRVLRLWMKEVFIPMNENVVDIIVERAQLLNESEMPAVLVRACANAWSWKAIARMWEEGDYSRHLPAVAFPGDEFREYTSRVFAQLKQEQNALLGSLAPDSK